MARIDKETAMQQALGVIKYQNFKTRIAVEKIGNGITSLVFNSGVSYVKYGKIYTHVMTNLMKECLDECIAKCIQPLTPKEEERRENKKGAGRRCTSKNIQPPIARLEVLQQPIAETFEYGVKIGNTIRLLKSESEANVFMDAINLANYQIQADKQMKCKLVEVKFNEVERG